MPEVREVLVPVENVNDETIAILKWLIDNGAFVEEGASLVLAETTKVTVDVAAPVAGFVWQVAQADTDVPLGSVLCYIADSVEAAKAAAQAALSRDQSVSPHQEVPPAEVLVSVRPEKGPASQREQPSASLLPFRTNTRFSARARTLMQQLGLDPSIFDGRSVVRERDVQAYGRPTLPVAATQKQTVLADPAATTDPVMLARDVPVRIEPLPRNKRYEGRRLRAAAANTVQASLTVSVPVAGFLSASWSTAKLPEGTAAAVIIAETARLLRSYPQFNAVCKSDELHYYDRVNVGYAIDLGLGLKVPVFHDADRKSVADLAEEKQRLIVEYLSETLSLEALSGGTFTITDLSGEGVEHFQPVLNDGQSAILGVCGAGASGSFNLVLTFDHQVAEGRSAAAFLKDLRDRIVAHEVSLRRSDIQPDAEPRCALCLRPASELEADRQFLLRVVTRDESVDTVCTVCVQDWS